MSCFDFQGSEFECDIKKYHQFGLAGARMHLEVVCLHFFLPLCCEEGPWVGTRMEFGSLGKEMSAARSYIQNMYQQWCVCSLTRNAWKR